MVVKKIINSVSVYFQKKFFRCALFLVVLLQILFLGFQYKYVREEVSNARAGLRLFYQDVIKVSLKIQEEVDKGAFAMEDILESIIESNPLVYDIKITENMIRDIKLGGYSSDSMVLKSTIILSKEDRAYLKGINLFIKNEVIKTYMIPYTRNGYNYYIHSSGDMLTSIKYYDVENAFGNFSINMKIDNLIDGKITVELPVYTFIGTNIKMLIITILLFASLYYYVFYKYEAFSKDKIESPIVSVVTSEINEMKDELEQIEESKRAVEKMEKLLAPEGSAISKNKGGIKKGHLEIIK